MQKHITSKQVSAKNLTYSSPLHIAECKKADKIRLQVQSPMEKLNNALAMELDLVHLANSMPDLNSCSAATAIKFVKRLINKSKLDYQVRLGAAAKYVSVSEWKQLLKLALSASEFDKWVKFQKALPAGSACDYDYAKLTEMEEKL